MAQEQKGMSVNEFIAGGVLNITGFLTEVKKVVEQYEGMLKAADEKIKALEAATASPEDTAN